MVRYLSTAAVCLLATGCGGADRDARRDPGTRAASRAATPQAAPSGAGRLLTVQRNGGASATLDLLTIYRDGTATLDKRYGGAGRRMSRFHVTTQRLKAIRSALKRLPVRAPRGSRADATDVTFILRARGRTYTAQQKSLGRRERALFAALDGVISGEGRQ